MARPLPPSPSDKHTGLLSVNHFYKSQYLKRRLESYIPTNPQDNQEHSQVNSLSKSLHPAIPCDIQFCHCTLPSGLSLAEGVSASSALTDISYHRNNFAIHHIPPAAPPRLSFPLSKSVIITVPISLLPILS